MKQAVNLLNALPIKERLKMPAILMFKIWGGFAIILLLWWGFGFWQKSTLSNQSAQLTQKERQLSGELIKLTQKFAHLTGQDEDARMKALMKHIERKQQLVAVLDKKESINVKGFSSLFISLAKVAPENLWFNAIEFENGGRDINFKGHALTTNLVFDMFSQMEKMKAFSQTPLKLISISSKKSDDEDGLESFAFNIGSEDHEG